VDTRRLATMLEDGCTEWDVPGAQVGLLRGDDRAVLCAGTTALHDGEPVRTDHAFHAGSIAKSLVAVVVLDAARRGELDLDVGCDRQAPGLWTDTPRALLAQTTGRPNELPGLDEDPEAFVARIAAMPLVHPPGRFSYVNAGWVALDVLLRHRCGATFEELATARVLGSAATFGMPDGVAAPGHGAGPGQPCHPVPDVYGANASAAGSRWWATADQLLDYAALHLGREDLAGLRRPHAAIPGATVADAWGLGWALWDRGEHRAFGWAGFTGGHRAFLRCFPDQDAALVVLTNCAGGLFGGPGGSALFDVLLPEALDVLGVPPLPAPTVGGPAHPTAELAGAFGPLRLEAVGEGEDDGLVLHAAAFGAAEPVALRRLGGDAFVVDGEPPGATPVAGDGDLLYVGPMAVPR
jgi:CubicO group peptidase (beta-lactamase class C family)